MATKQTTTPDPTGGVPIPQGGSTSKAVSPPISVPYYIIDPATGQPAVGPDGQPLRWGAQIPHQTHFDSAALTPAEQNRFVTGGGPQQSDQYVLPRYYDGSEWLPAQLPPDQLAQLQRKMVAAGLLKSGSAQLGVWDVTSMNAYKELLAYANASGLDAGAALDRWGQAHALDPNAGKVALQTTVSNPDELALVFRKAVIDTLGQGWNTDKINQMVAAYQGVERNAQTQSYNLSETGATNSPPVAPPSAQTFAASQARSENPLGAQEHDVIAQGGPLDAFKQMIAGWQ